MTLTFKGSPEPTVGVELEYQLIDSRTKELVSVAPEILAAFPEKSWVKPELMQCTIEINTRICRSTREVQEDLSEKIAQVREVADGVGVVLAGAGTHPFSRWCDQKITEDQRYSRLLKRVQWPARRMLIFGLHVHVGVPDGETAISIINHLEPWLPHLLALTASSPFWEGKESGLASSRSKVFEGLPTAGLPHRHKDWNEFARLKDALVEAQAIETFREIWWDLRPHPVFGTVEVRVCDAIPTLAETVAVTALIQALIVYLGRQIAAGATVPILHRRIVKENKWRASRWSTRGSTIVDDKGTVKPISRTIKQLLNELKPIFKELESEDQLPRVHQMLREGPSSDRQLRCFHKTRKLESVVDHLIREFEENKPIFV